MVKYRDGKQAGAPCAWYEPLKVSEPDASTLPCNTPDRCYIALPI
ncbi:hypothetical protein [Polluticaenibacter yanchengensis]|uniref:Uncharacterized protein n=1 Tax=Polluticaenibacter yanchengensis TaxID=3014562 RepID=A0ABT4UPL9_9BACT|nr:hypothetical protein [Chitinophagaceae bacterium LY-5]